MGGRILFGVVLITIVAAGIPHRKNYNEPTDSQYNYDSNENTKDGQDEDSTFEDPETIISEPTGHLVDKVVTIGPIFEGLQDRKEEDRKGKVLVFDLPDNNGQADYKGSPEVLSGNREKNTNPRAKYEVTENVVDIPDDRTVAGPIVHNFTKPTPLNLGGTPTEAEITTPEPEEVEDDKTVRSRISILHIKAEIDDNPVKKENKITNFFKGVKKYISGIKNGVVNGINKLFNKHDDDSKEKSLGDDDKSVDCDEENTDDEVSDEDDDHFA